MKHAIIVSAIIEKNGQYLFGRKPKDMGPYPNCWLLVGGKAYPEKECLEESVRREVKEETNLEIKNLLPVFFDEDHRIRKGEMTHLIFLTYLCKYKSGVEKPGDDIETIKWVKKSEIKNLEVSPPSVKLFRHLGWI